MWVGWGGRKRSAGGGARRRAGSPALRSRVYHRPRMPQTLPAFVAKWTASAAAERANKDAFLLELCDVLDVPRPGATTADTEQDTYVFEKDAILPHEGGKTTVGKIDLYKEGAFILEAKQGSDATSKKLGSAKRGTPGWAVTMNNAYGQAVGYARTFDKPVPFLIACDIGYSFDLYAAFDGSTRYNAFPDAARSRIYLKDLADHADTLRRVFTDPFGLDPARQSAKVTREVAEHLAELAKALEAAKHGAEDVATFLMRCLFTMFAEDVGLLPERLFTDAIEKLWLPNPKSFPVGVESLWHAMNDGGEFGFMGRLLRFNGGLFQAPRALPLTKEHLALLLEAAKCNWADVEPAIFGTLLERALDPKERHALGAHYTPRAYVERLVKPTIEEPLRADWDVVQAEVRQLVAGDKVEAAKKVLRAFHQKLCETRVLDPACGSGNFLYVTLDLFMRLEGEVLALLHGLGEAQTLLHADTIRVTPKQFLGIEVKRWAKEIAELVLWIGYLQHHFRAYGKTQMPPEPVLQDYRNIECRDAVLAWDSIELVRDANGKPVTRWDGETYKKSPVTGEDVPDEKATVPVEKYVNPRKAEWPKAEFIVGNPPFIGNWRLRQALGDQYVEALRATYPCVRETADYVVYWWDRSAEVVGLRECRQFGLITTNSLTQTFGRAIIQHHLSSATPVHLVFAIPDHPWVDSVDGADVRIAMTAAAAGVGPGTLLRVVSEATVPGDTARVELNATSGVIHADLSAGPDVTTARALRANRGVSCPGVKLHGAGFIVSRADAVAWGWPGDVNLARHVREYRNGRDLASTARHVLVVDLFGLSETEARALTPAAYQWVLERVKPERDQNRRASRRDAWWLFGESVPKWRAMSRGLPRYITTVETAKHRVFMFLDASILPDNMLINFAFDDASALGALSSRPHVVWTLHAGGTLEDRPRYNKTVCFDPFPFPACTDALTTRIRALGESLDAHRKRQQALHADLTITGMYNVLEKLRSGEALTAKEKVIHEHGLVSVLKQIHDDLDAAVFDAYGWPHDLTDEQILERLVALNAERAEEERNGLVRWLRPDFQNPGGTKAAKQAEMAGMDLDEEAANDGAAAAAASWPKKLGEQVAAVRGLVGKSGGEWTAAQGAKAFKGAKGKDVGDVMDALVAVGMFVAWGEGRERKWRGVG
jgi:hypothetical protein